VHVHHNWQTTVDKLADIDISKHLESVDAINVRHIFGDENQVDKRKRKIHGNNPFCDTWIEKVGNTLFPPDEWQCKLCGCNNKPNTLQCGGRKAEVPVTPAPNSSMSIPSHPLDGGRTGNGPVNPNSRDLDVPGELLEQMEPFKRKKDVEFNRNRPCRALNTKPHTAGACEPQSLVKTPLELKERGTPDVVKFLSNADNAQWKLGEGGDHNLKHFMFDDVKCRYVFMFCNEPTATEARNLTPELWYGTTELRFVMHFTCGGNTW
jgi:hypothetical protein